MARKLDNLGRRIFPNDAKAFKAQGMQARYLGVFSGVVQIPGGYVLLRDEYVNVYLN